MIICVGNFFLRSKRQDLAVRILTAVRKAVPEARLVFVGTGTHESACRHLAQELGVSEAVDFLGPRDRTEIPALLRSARVFLYCSESEGLPNVSLEAQATGLPVVATDIPAHREALSPTLHSYLFNPGELDQAATKITEILAKSDLAKALGDAGRAYVTEHYNASVVPEGFGRLLCFLARFGKRTTVNLNDAFFLMLLTATVPLLVTHYLRAPVFSNDFRGWVILGGLLWMADAVFSEVISGELLEVWKADGWDHAYMGGVMADYMRADKWNLVWDHMVVGNSMYQCYVGLIMYLTGTTDAFVTASNGWFGFWGGLVLIRHFHGVFPYTRKNSPWLLLIIFCPSVIYWTTMNVKRR